MDTNETIDEGIASAIEAVVRDQMGRFDVQHVDVSPSLDSDGDPVLAVAIDYGGRGEPFDPQVAAGLVTKMRDRLWALDERRFPRIQHRFRAEPKIASRR